MFTFDPFNLSHTANIFDFDILLKGAQQYLWFIAVRYITVSMTRRGKGKNMQESAEIGNDEC